ncbi:hypothetical protein DHX103_00295 [Planococcus sp. X10-3]|uniref:COG4315 family predicted lipoprotein n=1 Tax=Planococcus sp. X10-3 TaxID=3061240 RepID=UPI003BAE467D
MEKRLFLFTILSALFLLAACGNDQENYMGGDPSPPEETEEPAGTEENSTDDDNGETDDSDDNEDSEQALRVMENDSVGEYLADSEGMTLYYFTNDEPETSNCTDDCLVNWPAFTASEIDEPEGYEDDDFDTITREDNGEEQVTYKGYPLYYFVNDMIEGDVNGQGLNDAWYIVNDTTEFPE